MICFPNAKLNLGLTVLPKRPDGFHDLRTVFFPAGLADALEIVPTADGVTGFAMTGIPVPGDPGENLCIKAYHLIREDFPVPPVKIHLHKVIPTGAGLGGGSSDAAFTIKILNSLFRLGLTDARMEDYARNLGSDCPFFIRNKACYATGRGDIFNPVEVRLKGYLTQIVIPGIHVNTAEAYAWIDDDPPAQNTGLTPAEAVSLPLESWKDNLFNDFEEPVFAIHPELRDIKEDLYASGALYASMSGSGSAVFGIFAGPPASGPGKYFSYSFEISS